MRTLPKNHLSENSTGGGDMGNLKLLGLYLVVVIFLLCGCSGKGVNPVAVPDEMGSQPVDNPSVQSDSSHMLWGIWTIDLDLSGMHADIEPVRNPATHYNITDMILPPSCPNCLTIQINEFNPSSRILDVSVILKNPFALTGQDVRGILFTDDAGHGLRNADEWTPLWDIPGGDTINPFIKFHGLLSDFTPGMKCTRQYQIYIPKPPHYEQIAFAVDVSWPGHCKEPAGISFKNQETIYADAGSKGLVSIGVHDWQDDVNNVTLSLPQITGEDATQLEYIGESIWGVEIINQTGASPGYYRGKVRATSGNSGDVALYDFVEVLITEATPFILTDVTPPWLNFAPRDICRDGDYIYIASYFNGLHIFSVSNPVDPIWINEIDIPDNAVAVSASAGYAYVACKDDGLVIVDVDPPESAYVVKTIDLPFGKSNDVAYYNGYVFVVTLTQRFYVIDVDPPESAYLVTTLYLDGPGNTANIDVADGYAYVTRGDELYIIDIEPAETPELVNTVVDLFSHWEEITVSNGYAFVVAPSYDLYILDIDPPEEAHVITQYTWFECPSDISVSWPYAYVTQDGDHSDYKLLIFDVSNPEYIFTSKKLELAGSPVSVISTSEYAYLGDIESGLITLDVSPIEDAHIIDAERTPSFTKSVCRYSDYLYMAGSTGLMIIDLHSPEDASVAGFVEGNYEAVDVDGDYAYAMDYNSGLQVIDVNPPETSNIYKAVGYYGGSEDIVVSSGYAYVANHIMGLGIVDIDPIDSAYIVGNVIPSNSVNRIEVQNGYAYMTGGSDYFISFDIDPPTDAKVLNQVDLSGNQKELAVQGDYAYVAGGSWDNLEVVNISDPAYPYLTKQLELASNTNSIAVEGHYAYLTNNSTSTQPAGLQIVNISPPEQAHLVQTFEIKGGPKFVAVSDGYLYVAGPYAGLHILKIDEF